MGILFVSMWFTVCYYRYGTVVPRATRTRRESEQSTFFPVFRENRMRKWREEGERRSKIDPVREQRAEGECIQLLLG